MSTTVPHIELPEHDLAILGEPDPGTRTYHRFGPAEDFAPWFDAVCELCAPDGVVSPGGVGLYAKVSRAGVHKRMKEGRLTAFLFHLTTGPAPPGQRRKALEHGGRPFTCIPVQECRAWAGRLRGKRQGRQAGQEPQGPGPGRRASQADDSWRQW
jgi:hypothetical protein